MPYTVKDNLVNLGINGAKYRGDIIEDQELEGIDVQRLIDLGAIASLARDEAPPVSGVVLQVTSSEEKKPAPSQEMSAEFLRSQTKVELASIGKDFGLELDPDGMNKEQMVQAILKALK